MSFFIVGIGFSVFCFCIKKKANIKSDLQFGLDVKSEFEAKFRFCYGVGGNTSAQQR